MSEAALPRYTQRKPPEWDGLVEVAQASLRADAPYEHQTGAAVALWDTIAQLDIETLEANRYYGIGLVACGYARTNFVGAGRKRFIDTQAQDIVNAHQKYCDRALKDDSAGLYLNEIGFSCPDTRPNKQQLEDLYRHLTLEERLTANALEMFKPLHSSHKRDAAARNYEVPNILNSGRDRVYNTLVVNALAGPSLMARMALHKLHRQRTGHFIAFNNPGFNPALKDFASEADIAALNLENMSAVAASMREDETWQKAEELMTMEENGRKSLPLPKDPGPPGRFPNGGHVMHQRRLRCPLRFVEDSIPFVAQAMPQVILEAQRQLTAPSRR